jgi:acetyl-CoA C-acetyltransferase
MMRNISPIAKILAWSDGEREPVDFGIAPSISIQRALAIANLSVADIDLWEINEAFAAIVLANMKLLGDIPPERVNSLGGAVSLGHPLGCSGARIVCTLLTALRHKGFRTGCAAICNGGGGSTAIIVRLVE